MKFYGGVESGPRSNHLDFYGDPIWDSDPASSVFIYIMSTAAVLSPFFSPLTSVVYALISVGSRGILLMDLVYKHTIYKIICMR